MAFNIVQVTQFKTIQTKKVYIEMKMITTCPFLKVSEPSLVMYSIIYFLKKLTSFPNGHVSSKQRKVNDISVSFDRFKLSHLIRLTFLVNIII